MGGFSLMLGCFFIVCLFLFVCLFVCLSYFVFECAVQVNIFVLFLDVLFK